MIEIDFNECKLKPYAHQKTGVKRLIANPIYGLLWQMRLGKSKAIIDTACFLHKSGELDIVVIAAPAQVKEVWLDKSIGELKTHCFVPYTGLDFDSKSAEYIDILVQEGKDLRFLLVSHEFLRQEDAKGDFPRVNQILRSVEGKKWWLVLEEASAFGSHKSIQSKAALKLRMGQLT